MTQAGPISPFSGNLEFELREYTVAFFLFFGDWTCNSGDFFFKKEAGLKREWINASR